jgi:hypothetical protein
VAFGDQQREFLTQTLAEGPERKIVLAEDETFHPKPCLVAIAPASDFIMLEGYSEKRDAATWNAELQKELEGLNVRVVQYQR